MLCKLAALMLSVGHAEHYGEAFSNLHATPRMPTSTLDLSQSAHPAPHHDAATGAVIFALATAAAPPEAAHAPTRASSHHRVGSRSHSSLAQSDTVLASPARSALPSLFHFSPPATPQRPLSPLRSASRGAASSSNPVGAPPPLAMPSAFVDPRAFRATPPRRHLSDSPGAASSHYESVSSPSPSTRAAHRASMSMSPHTANWWSSLRLGGFNPRNYEAVPPHDADSPVASPTRSPRHRASGTLSRSRPPSASAHERGDDAPRGIMGMLSAAFQPSVRSLFCHRVSRACLPPCGLCHGASS